MTKLKTRIFAFLLCMSLAVPMQIVEAAEVGMNENIDTDSENIVTTPDEGLDSSGALTPTTTPNAGAAITKTPGSESSDDDEINSETPDSDSSITKSPDTTTPDDGESNSETSDSDTPDSDTPDSDAPDSDTSIIPKLVAAPKLGGFAPMLYGADATPPHGPHGSGSYQLNENPDDYRFYTEYFVKADSNKTITSAGVDRRTAIKVYAKKGEIILFGSSVSNSQIDENNQFVGSETGKDIVITTPSGGKVCEDVLSPGQTDKDNVVRANGLGYIQNPTQEMYGPMISTVDKDYPQYYYVPLQYEAPETGVYTFEFHSVTGFNPNSANGDHPTPTEAGNPWSQGRTAVAAWDVTVLSQTAENEYEVKSGRAWADYLALTTGGGAGIESDLNVHVLSHDGYQYKVDFEQAMPYGFIFFANNTGFMTAVTDEDSHTTSYRPIYHSFYDSNNDLNYMSSAENIYLHKPDEVDTATEETYKIFFNAPNSDLNNVTYVRDGKTETIKTEPKDKVDITDLRFSGGSYENIARTGHGGYFQFNATEEATITIRLDLRKAILNAETSGSLAEPYKGSGIVEITAPVVEGPNSLYWDGKDTDGIVIPAGIYGDSNVILATEVKRGELHFPVIDMEGLYGGLTVKRINGKDIENGDVHYDDPKLYDLYYNNNPLVYGTIEGAGYSKKVDGKHYALTDGTKSYKLYSDTTLSNYFNYGQASITTLKKDDKEYLAQKFFGTSYSSLVEGSIEKQIIDAEFNKEQDTFHFEPVDSKTTTIKFNCEGYEGGGNKAGIDAWTYYTQGIVTKTISFAIMDTNARGVVKGQIFYDADISSSYNVDDNVDGKDYLLSGVRVRLIGEDGNPLVHKESLPCFDENGRFIYDEYGKVQHEEKDVEFESITDSTGTYRFIGVPYSTEEKTKYYVQVLLTEVQSEDLRYTCTTSSVIKTNLKTKAEAGAEVHYFIPQGNTIAADCGADGNTIVATDDINKIYQYKYAREKDTITDNLETVFDMANAQQPVVFSPTDGSGEGSSIVVTKEFKKIGFSSTVPADHQKDYKVTKIWAQDSARRPIHPIYDGLIVELWVWNDHHVDPDGKLELSRRTGSLIDTQVLVGTDPDYPENGGSYTWKGLDDRLQYYVLEYYTKKKPNGEIIYNDKGEARKVLIGGTMPIFSANIPESKIYGFNVGLGEYPESIEYPEGSGKYRIPVQYFDDSKTHTNSITKKEKLESVDNNARQYNVTYKLTKENSDKTNVIELTNSQVLDDRTYYVWLDHEAKLPELISQTFLEGGEKKSHAVSLEKDVMLDDGSYTIKGLSISSVDAAEVDNVEGNATKAFRISEDGKDYASFTATNHGNYKTGTGTRTYQVKYVVDSDKHPVSVTVDNGALVLSSNHSTKVEDYPTVYSVYSWYMTIHVYDVVPDGVIEYDPNGGPVVLQNALAVGTNLKWTLSHGANENKISYTSDDPRKSGILMNDTYRLPLYKAAENPDMGSCADIVGIAYAGSSPEVDFSQLKFADTYESRYGSSSEDDGNSGAKGKDGEAIAQGSGGYVTVDLNTLRITRINRVQDHANYANVTFTPGQVEKARGANGEDVFYYKIVVFAEDNTYQYNAYDEIDASEGVMMYTYFTMKPKKSIVPVPPQNVIIPNNNGGTLGANGGQTITVIPLGGELTSGIKPGPVSPKTGDDNNLILWLVIAILTIAVIVLVVSKQKVKIPKEATLIICAAGVILLAYAGYMFISQLSDYAKSSSEYKKAAIEYVSLSNDEEIDEIAAKWEDLVDVDIASLRKENKDVVGWIFFENEDISYPVLHTDDDSTYLTKTYTGENSSAGSIFMEGKNNSNFSDAHTIIYGHNMKNLSMFGKLRYYAKDKDYINGHEYFQIITDNRKFRYKIFSYKVVPDDSNIYTIYKDGNQDFQTFVKNVVQNGSYLQANENAADSNHLVTLSTCFGDDRLVVTAVRCGDCIMLD